MLIEACNLDLITAAISYRLVTGNHGNEGIEEMQ